MVRHRRRQCTMPLSGRKYTFSGPGSLEAPPYFVLTPLLVVSGPQQIGNYPSARILLRMKETWNRKEKIKENSNDF